MQITDSGREHYADLGVRIGGPGSSGKSYSSLSPATSPQESSRKRLNFKLTAVLTVYVVSSYFLMTIAFVIHEYFDVYS